MQFINNWGRDITLPAGATSLALDLPDGSYRLTLTDSKFTPSMWEIVGAEVVSGAATLTRAMESTADLDWPAGSYIYCSLTASVLTDLVARLANLEANAEGMEQAITELEARVAALEPAEPIIVGSDSFGTVPQGIFGYSPQNSAGSISPEGATVYPDGTLSVGGLGEITELSWSSDYPYYGSFVLRIRGAANDWPTVDSLPFETLTIGSTSLAKADATSAGVGDGQSLFQWTGIDNPLADGNNTVTFS